ncbi:MAG: endonuclease MutS2 [Oscillospiraceae bacterium]|jgi:DNA mismatch repair protein MutS2|nr:endonuclease MutS2 [Oscillospiraceae bacterium]
MNKHYKTLELDKVLALLAEKCACGDARELALATEPEQNLKLAQALLNQTRDAHTLLARFGGPAFGGLLNVNNALHRAQAGGTLTLRELLAIAQTLRVLRGIVAWREGSAGVPTCLDALFGGISPNHFLEDAIASVVLSEDSVADHASPALADIRRKIRQQESNVRQRLEHLTRSSQYSKYLQESLVTMRGGRFVVPVKAEFRGEIAGLVHDASSSGATVFVEPMAVVEANNEIKVLQGKEREEIDRILAELSELAGGFYDPIKYSYECAVELNVIFAKAHLAYDMKASAPELNDGGIICLKKARHPLISKDSVVPIDISLGETFSALVITGPNTGGKTVTLKTLGLLTLMGMCGLMLPCAEHSKIAVFRHILADIGDEQSIEQSLSTFSSHMINIISILEEADAGALVLIDELGAGTDPVEGAALATAILEALRGRGAKLAATTHYAELKAYALQAQGVENGSCEFDVETLRPTYRLLIGVPGRSNAFAISERLGMPNDIVNRARDLVSGENTRFENVIGELEQRQNLAAKAREEADRLRLRAQEALAEAERAKEEAAAKQAKALADARLMGQEIAAKAKREAYALLGELERLKKAKETSDVVELARRARSAMKKGLEAMDEATRAEAPAEPDDEGYVLPRPLRLGDPVRLADLKIAATITQLADSKGQYTVQAGSMSIRTPESNLRLLNEPRAAGSLPLSRKARPSQEEPIQLHTEAAARLDLRGQTADEAALELDRFVDAALRSGLHEFTVVHGKGTGVLRETVKQYLRGSQYVKTFRLGGLGEGDTGVTIVELK